VRAGDGIPGSPAKQQRVERAKQSWRRQHGGRVLRAPGQLGQAVRSLYRAAPPKCSPAATLPPEPCSCPLAFTAVAWEAFTASLR
jgi:hypothetical protein